MDRIHWNHGLDLGAGFAGNIAAAILLRLVQPA